MVEKTDSGRMAEATKQAIPSPEDMQRIADLHNSQVADAPSPTPSVSTPGAFRAEFSLSPVETHAMLAMEDKNMIATIIANEFSKQLRQQLTAEQMEGVIRLNAAELDKVGICHTHDFCDGNEIMLHALEALGIERISDELWNEAWSIAKGAGFTPAPSVAGTQPTPIDEIQVESFAGSLGISDPHDVLIVKLVTEALHHDFHSTRGCQAHPTAIHYEKHGLMRCTQCEKELRLGKAGKMVNAFSRKIHNQREHIKRP